MFWVFDSSAGEAFKKAWRGLASAQLRWYLAYIGLYHKWATLCRIMLRWHPIWIMCVSIIGTNKTFSSRVHVQRVHYWMPQDLVAWVCFCRKGLNLLVGVDCISLASCRFTSFGHSWHTSAFWSCLFLSPPLHRCIRHLWFITCPKTLFFFFARCCVVVGSHQLLCYLHLFRFIYLPRFIFLSFFFLLLINIWIL